MRLREKRDVRARTEEREQEDGVRGQQSAVCKGGWNALRHLSPSRRGREKGEKPSHASGGNGGDRREGEWQLLPTPHLRSRTRSGALPRRSVRGGNAPACVWLGVIQCYQQCVVRCSLTRSVANSTRLPSRVLPGYNQREKRAVRALSQHGYCV